MSRMRQRRPRQRRRPAPPPASAVVEGRYRYDLWRRWGPSLTNGKSTTSGAQPSTCAWVMLNPSTADALQDDPTVRRVMGFSRAWGFSAARVVNLFAYRTPSPAHLWERKVPIVGPLNNDYLRDALSADRVVFAWGAAKDPRVAERASWLEGVAKGRGVRPMCLGTVASGSPRHPLFVPAAAPPVSYPPPSLREDGSEAIAPPPPWW